MSLLDVTVDPYIDSIEKKRQYNKEYYRNTVKPKRQLQRALQAVETTTLPEDRSFTELIELNKTLTAKVARIERELLAVKQALDTTRRQNHELILLNAKRILPDVGNLSPPS